MDGIDITGIDKARLLQSLYRNTRAIGVGAFHDRRDGLTIEECRAAVARSTHDGRCYFDYVAGRPIKSRIGGDTFDPRLYDRDAGEGAGARAVAEARASR